MWSNPPTALAGQEIHVTVGIARTETGEPVLDAAVAVTLIKESGEVIATAEATTDQSANRLFYETDLDGVAIGLYEVQIEVTGREGSGTLLFPLAVEAAPLWPWLVGTAAVGGILVLVLRYWRKGVKTAVSRRQTAVSRTRSVD